MVVGTPRGGPSSHAETAAPLVTSARRPIDSGENSHGTWSGKHRRQADESLSLVLVINDIKLLMPCV